MRLLKIQISFHGLTIKKKSLLNSKICVIISLNPLTLLWSMSIVQYIFYYIFRASDKKKVLIVTLKIQNTGYNHLLPLTYPSLLSLLTLPLQPSRSSLPSPSYLPIYPSPPINQFQVKGWSWRSFHRRDILNVVDKIWKLYSLALIFIKLYWLLAHI